MNKVYSVSSGLYSDFHIMAVFTTEAMANAYVAAAKQLEDPSVTEWEVDQPIEWGYLTQLLMDRQGATYHVRTRWRSVTEAGYTLCRDGNTSQALHSAVVTGDAPPNDPAHVERAIKVTNEIRTRLIASGEWA